MRRIESFITEMSAVRNREADRIRAEIEELNKKLEDSEDAAYAKTLDLAGLLKSKDDKSLAEIYKIAKDISDIVLTTDKPELTLLYILVNVVDYMNNFKSRLSQNRFAAQLSHKYDDLLSKMDALVADNIIDFSKLCNVNLDAKIEAEIAQAKKDLEDRKKANAEIDKKIDVMEKKYPGLSEIRFTERRK